MENSISDAELSSLLNDGKLPQSLRDKMRTDPQVKQTMARLVLALSLPVLEEESSAEVDAAVWRMWPAVREMAEKSLAESPRAQIPAPMRMAASTVRRPQRSGADRSAIIHACFVSLPNGAGHIRPIVVDVADAPALDVQTLSECDDNMEAAATDAAKSAIALLHHYRLIPEDRSLRVTWLIREKTPMKYEGASIGLALSLAIFAAAAGVEAPLDICATGAADAGQVLGVQAVERKWEAASRHAFATFYVPRDSSRQLPQQAYARPDLRVVPVDTVEDAVKDLFDSMLGLSSSRFAAATESAGQNVRLEVFVTRVEEPATRTIGYFGGRRPDRLYLKDQITYNVRTNRAAYIALFNIGASGNVTLLLPNSHEPDTLVRPQQTRSFGGFILNEPSGIERLIAIASEQPIPAPAKDFPRMSKGDLEQQIPRIAGTEVGRHEISFRVYPLPSLGQASTRGIGGAVGPVPRPATPRALVIADF